MYHFLDDITQQLKELTLSGSYRFLTSTSHAERNVVVHGKSFLNCCSNDYLGIASDETLKEKFLNTLNTKKVRFSSSSSRLLSGNDECFDKIENTLCNIFGTESALVFNGGYTANIGILPAISDKETIIIVDKLIHASLMDGIKLSSAKYIRFKHNDYTHLAQLIERHKHYKKIIVVVESIYSMDGDVGNLQELCQLKKSYNNVLLYVDEAHAIGVRGTAGLGIAEEQNCIKDIDFLVGTFGKAIGSVGAYLICKHPVKDFLINKMRSFIFSTALPPINILWTNFILQQMGHWIEKRRFLSEMSTLFVNNLPEKYKPNSSQSHIIPIITGDSVSAQKLSDRLMNNGFYALPIRPPTVPNNKCRIRISLTADFQKNDIDHLLNIINNC